MHDARRPLPQRATPACTTCRLAALSRGIARRLDNADVPPPTRQREVCARQALGGRWELEAHHLAHSDLADGNIVVAPDGQGVEWWDPHVRALTPDGADALFRPSELQEVGDACWQCVRDAI